MPSKIEFYSHLAEQTAVIAAGSYQGWTDLLRTMGRVFKYPYPEQLMIYAQRPDATACAEYTLWNERMHRFVRKGSVGIALLDSSGDRPALRYVFDVADTGTRKNGRTPYLFQYAPEHEAAVAAALERRYSVTGTVGLANQIENAVIGLTREYWEEHQQDILHIIDGSFLQDYDEYNAGVSFRAAAEVSAAYVVLSRCGLDPDNFFQHEDFLPVFDFNTPQSITALGTAVSQSSETVLRTIEATIKRYEREKQAERSQNHEPDLQDERRLQNPQPAPVPNSRPSPGQVRPDAQDLPQGASPGAVEQPDPVREAVSPSSGDRRDSEPAVGAADAGDDESSRSDGGAESRRPHEMDGADEHLQGTGGGNDPGGADLQLTEETPVISQQFSFFLPEKEQIQRIDEAESVMPSAFSISEEDLGHILRLGGNTTESRRKIVTEFSKDKPVEELAAFLQKSYHGGNGFHFDSGDVCAWYAEDGIHLAKGRAARNVSSAQIIPWEEAAECIDAMLNDGRFAANTEIAEAPRYERRQIAETLLYLYHDLTEEAHEAGILSVLDELRGGGYPDETQRLSAFLEQPENRARLMESYSSFLAAYQEGQDILRFRYHRPVELGRRLQELDLPRLEYQSDMANVPAVKQFITEDEIAEALAGGSGVNGGKLRIYAFFREQHTLQEQADFLKQEYGTGGHSHAVSGADRSGEDHSSKGMVLKKGDCADVQMGWNNVAKRIAALIQEERYLNAQEKVQLANLEREYAGSGGIPTPKPQFGFPKPETAQADQPAAEDKTPSLAQDYKAVKEAHPDDIVLYQVGDFFEAFGADAENAAEALALTLTSRMMDGQRIPMCGIPGHRLEGDTERLRDKYDITISAVDKESGLRKVYSLLSVDHEAEKAIDEHEAEFGADGTHVFRDVQEEPPQPTLRELLEQYQPTVIRAVTEDTAYRNACGHSDRENAAIECSAAVRRAILNSGDMQLIKLFSDFPEFRRRLHQQVFAGTHPQLHELLRPLSEKDIDEAVCAWNGKIDSKHAVVRYMEAHARERNTAAWLAQEYGGNDRIVVRAGSPEETFLSWSLVQSRIARLIQEDNFYTDAERDNFNDIDPIAVRERLESGESSRFVQQVMADVERIAAQDAAEQAQQPEPTVESPGSFAYGGFHFQPVGVLGESFDANDVVRHTVSHNGLGMSTYADAQRPYTHGTFYAAAGNTKADVFRCLETGKLYIPGSNELFEYTGEFQPFQENVQEAAQAEQPTEAAPAAQTHREPLEPPYKVGDTLYLEDGQAFIVESIGIHDVQLRDPSLVFPIFRSESKEHLRQLLERYPQTEEARQEAEERIAANDEEDLSDDQLNQLPISVMEHGRVVTYPNAEALFEQQEAQQPPEVVPYPSETVAVYPAERNNLPYDVVIETLHFDEPEQGQPQQLPPENYRITDDNLGVGGPKEKFRKNMAAITTLQRIESEGRQATSAEQEILSRYVGWGGLADAFDESKSDWAKEFAELNGALSPEEYAAARASTLNAHYTSPTVIRAIYQAVESMGFQTGNILEPSMGVGNFFGMLPESMQGSRLYGVELDSLTGRIAKQLYPNANITVSGFEKTDRKDFFDLAVGNVPFGQYQVNDPAFNKLNFHIHNYFFAKALDQLRPGGVLAFVTSRYTMDSKDTAVRKYLAQRAELLGAIRLPNNAFKANAGTEVVSDILFLQKRDRPVDLEPSWVSLAENQDGFAINRYFVENPGMILGRPSSQNTQYGKQDFTVEPYEDRELGELLQTAISNIHGQYQETELPELGEEEAISKSIPADPDVKNYSYTLVDGEVYYRENSIMVRPQMNATAMERVKGMIALRQCVHELIDLQMDFYTSDAQIQEKQTELNSLYDAFTQKYGLINDRGNRLAFSDDPAYYLLCSLEVLDEDGKLERKADMFTKRTIRKAAPITRVDTASEALAISIAEHAKVDMPYMSQLSGKTVEALAQELRGVIFRLPEPVGETGQPRYVMADEYLSGNVRQKLAAARRATEASSIYQDNVTALEKAQPKDLDASEIDVRLGATWIDSAYIQQFMEELLNPPFYLRRSIQVMFSPYTAEWRINGKNNTGYRDVNATSTYGTGRINAYHILEDSLNLRDVRVYDTVTDPDGKERRVLNQKETTLAQQKQAAIREAFKEWLWKDPERRQTLVKLYNEKFNSVRPREYDGSHIHFVGMSPEISLREHQRNAIAHVLYGGNTLLAHEVGSGKTFEMVAAAMESKRLGLCSKSLIVVPNHLTEQWASEFLRLYPSANILVARKKDFEPARRKTFCAKIATGDYDAVIIGHSQFEKIPISTQRQQRIIQSQIDEVEEGIEELRNSGGEKFTVKSLERTKRSLEARLEKLMSAGRKDDVVTFEQLGVDRLFVDEAHAYKNLFLYTKMQNVAGISTTDAQKSSDMYAKCRYMDELTGGKGVIFATGTPVSNSMTELYTMMRYLQHDTLQQHGWNHFDCWAAHFGETKTVIELAPEGYNFCG